MFKISYIFPVLILFYPFLSFGEDCGDTIKTTSKWNKGYLFSYNCSNNAKVFNTFSINQYLETTLLSYDSSATKIKGVNTMMIIGNILGIASGAIIGWNLADLTFGKPINKPFMLATIPMICVGLTLSGIAGHKVRTSIKLFNRK